MSASFVRGNWNDASGTSLRGYVTTTYATIVEKLGEPDTDGDNCEWILKFEDGSVATIYDWKTRQTPKDEYEWHIGGNHVGCAELVSVVLGIPAIEEW